MTQVVSSLEGTLFHNRLTHSLKVAQVSRRIAEKFLRDQPEVCDAAGGLDPDVAETAGLAHDIGHPPFGHVGEEELDRIAKERGLEEGFEGNAQSFRVVCNLALRSGHHPGLDLTAASLNAVLKYPWLHGHGPSTKKFACYRTEHSDFAFARELWPDLGVLRSPEADLMDWADDVTYSVHDVEDFFRAGLVRLDVLRQSRDEVTRFLAWLEKKWSAQNALPADFADYERVLTGLVGIFPIPGPYDGSRTHRELLRTYVSREISTLVQSITLKSEPSDGTWLEIDPNARRDVKLLKQLIWYYVIDQAALGTQQVGKRRIIRTVAEVMLDAVEAHRLGPLPARFSSEIEANEDPDPMWARRVAIDAVASMSEPELISVYERVAGINLGSVRELTV